MVELSLFQAHKTSPPHQETRNESNFGFDGAKALSRFCGGLVASSLRTLQFPRLVRGLADGQSWSMKVIDIVETSDDKAPNDIPAVHDVNEKMICLLSISNSDVMVSAMFSTYKSLVVIAFHIQPSSCYTPLPETPALESNSCPAEPVLEGRGWGRGLDIVNYQPSAWFRL